MVNASSGPLPNPPPSSTATALTRPDELSTKRTLGDLSEEELRMLAAIVVHERPTLATRALAARGPLAIAATSFVGAGALFWNAVASTGPARIWIGTLGLAALSVGLTMLALVSRTPRFSAFAPAVAFLEERGVASRHLNGILRRLSAVVSGTSRSGDVEAVYRCLAPWGARDAEHPGQEPRADLLPAALLTGIARDWLATRPPLATIFAVAANPLLQLLRGQEGLLDLDRALLVCLGVIPVAFLSIKRLLPMRKAFLASLELGLADGEEQRLVDVFNAALKETRRERRKLSHEDAAALIVQKVLALLDDKVPVDSALDDERRRLLHDRGAEPAPQAVDDVVVADEAVATKGR